MTTALAVAAGVGGGGGGADGDAGRAAGQGQQDGLGEELGADLAAGGAQGAAQADLVRRSRTEMTMMLATPMAPTSRATAPRPRNRVSSAPLASAWAVSAAEGWETATWPGFSGLAWAPSRLSTAVVAAGVSGGADVDLRGVAVEAEVALGGGEADQDRGVDLGGVGGGA